jgi:DNA-binding transcriptional LysR family regulator
MELRQLRYFITVADERSITRAAQRLNMTQPPLSRQLQQLEGDIGMGLFERGARPLQLTAAGKVFYEQAKRLIGEADGLAGLTRRLVQSSERVVIGFVPSTMYGALPQVIRAFRRAAPQLALSLIEMFTLEQVSALKEGRIDIGFGRLRLDDPDLRREVLLEERIIAAVPLDHPLAVPRRPGAEASPGFTLEDFSRETLIVYPSHPRPSYADQQLAALRDCGVEPAAVHEVRELQTALGLVAAGVGVTLVPESVNVVKVRGVAYRKLPGLKASSPIIMSRRQRDHSAITALLDSVARTQFRG